MFCLLHYRDIAAQHRFRVDQVGGIQGRSTLFTLVSIRFFESANRTGPGDVTIGEEMACLFIVILFGSFFNELSGIIHLPEEFSCGFVMDFIGGAGVNVK